MTYEIFPVLNATLNGLSGALLLIGHSFIERGKIAAHRACMIAAFCSSTVFLALTHNPGSQPARPGSHNPGAGAAQLIPAAQGHRPLDLSHLALCLGHRRLDLFYGLQVVCLKAVLISVYLRSSAAKLPLTDPDTTVDKPRDCA